MKKLLVALSLSAALFSVGTTKALATVPSCATPCRMDHVGNGASTSFAYTFKIQSDSHLAVYLDGVLKTLTTHYTVTGVGNSGGGTVVFTTPPTNNAKIAILRNIPDSQLTDYVEGDAFPASAHEDALDRLVMLHQQQEEKLNRAVKLPVESTLDSITLPEGAGKYIRWNGGGTGLEAVAGSTAELPANPDPCPANQFVRDLDASGVLSCAQPSFSDLSGSATIAQGGTGGSTAPADALLVGDGTMFQRRTLPSCSNATNDKLLYNSTTDEFSCGSDQSSAPGGGITSLNGLAGATQTFTHPDDTNVTLGITSSGTNHEFALGWSGTLAVGRGGTGLSTASDDNVLVGNGSAWVQKGLPNCPSGALAYDTASNNFSCAAASSFDPESKSIFIENFTTGHEVLADNTSRYDHLWKSASTQASISAGRLQVIQQSSHYLSSNNGVNEALLFDSSRNPTVKLRWAQATTGSGTRFVGIGVDASHSYSNPDSGYYFRHTDNGGNIIAVCRNSDTETTLDTGVAAANGTFHTGRIVINHNGGSPTAAIYIDGVSKGTISTNCPTTALTAFVATGATTADVDVDYIFVEQNP